MPWTPREVRYLLSSGSPLSEEKKTGMKAELHADPSLGHKAPGVNALAQGPRKKRATGTSPK